MPGLICAEKEENMGLNVGMEKTLYAGIDLQGARSYYFILTFAEIWQGDVAERSKALPC